MKGKDQGRKEFFSKLSYSFGNEDWRTEQQALQIKKGDHVLCISASGDRSLHLLLNDCGKLTSVDANPIQNHLLRLKCAALRSLDYDDYIGFLGGVPHSHRDSAFTKVKHHLDDDSAHFWSRHQKMIRRGILYQGNLEKLTAVTSNLFKVLRPKKVRDIFNMKTVEEQKAYLSKWDTFLFRKSFQVILSSKICKLFAADPFVYAHIDPDLGIGTYIYARMMHSLSHSLAKDNLLFSLIFRGYIEPSAFPPYLNPEGFPIIRNNLDRLSIETNDIIEHLNNTPSETYDRYSLSDVASYLSQEEFNKLIAAIHRTAKPGARFCLRQFSSDHKMPKEYESFFNREPVLEKRLADEDRCFVYRFMVGEVVK